MLRMLVPNSNANSVLSAMVKMKLVPSRTDNELMLYSLSPKTSGTSLRTAITNP